MRLLLIEDDAMLGEAVQHALKREGFSVDWVRDGAAAELALRDTAYALALLDLGLPRKDGLTLLRCLRARDNPLPVIVVTARDALEDRVAGLNAGADDYVVKPFEIDELIARIRALLRRQAGRASPEIRYGRVTLNPLTHEAALDGQPVALSAREFALLEALLEQPGAVVSRQRLEDKLYGWGEEVASNAVEVHLHNLRKKLGTELIRNIRGVGYLVVKGDRGTGNGE